MRVQLLVEGDALRGAIAAALTATNVDVEGGAADPALVGISDAGAAELREAGRHAGRAVIGLGDAAAVAAALTAGWDDCEVWPGEARVLAARIAAAQQRVTRARWLPWLEQLLALSTDAVELTDRELCLLRVNPAFTSVTGYEPAEALGKTDELFRIGAHEASYYSEIASTIARGEVWRGQLVAGRRDGSLSFQHATVVEVRDGDAVLGTLALKRDAARDEVAKSATITSAKRLQKLVDEAADPLFVHGVDGRIADANRSACELLGRSRAELLASSMSDLVPPGEAGPLAARWASLEPGEPATFEAHLARRKGEPVPVELRMTSTKIAGTPFVVALARDVTERRRAAAAMQEANELLRSLNERLESQVKARTRELHEALAQLGAIVEHLVDGLLGVGPDRTIRVVNQAVTGLLEQSASSLVGHPADAVLGPELARVIDDCMTTNAVQRTEVPLGDRGVAAALASPIRGADDTCIGCAVILRDVTLEREIDRMKTDFIATVSHELRTPLTSVLGFAKLARSQLESRVFPYVDRSAPRTERAMEKVANNLGIIVSEGERLTHIINDVLDISKMEAGRLEWKMERVSPREMVEATVNATSALFEESAVALVSAVDDDLPDVTADRHRLMQALINLVSNAQKFTGEGQVTIGARRAREGVELFVSDTGAGIPRSMQETVFEKFKQAGDTLTDKPRGSGLGLPISRQIVRAHGSEIVLESAVGEGSRFSFVLGDGVAAHSADTRRAVEAIVQRLRQLEPRGEGGGEVLVVDDDPHLQVLVRESLTAHGYRVRSASDGLSAMREVRAQRPDLIVLDIRMPDISGFDVASMLRSDPSTRTIPIVVLSIVRDEERGFALGIDTFLPKPFDEQELVDTIASLIHPARATLRILVVEDELPGPVVAQALVMRGYEVVGTCRLEGALPQAKAERPDVIVMESRERERGALVEHVRRDQDLEHTRFVFVIDRE